MTLRSKPRKQYATPRLRLIGMRIAFDQHAKPKRIAHWDGRRLLTGHKTQRRTPAARRWLRLLRLKLQFATWFRRQEL
jgi:hypothetical protein